MEFNVIPDQQTPETPQISNPKTFIKEHLETIESFKDYAISRTDAIGLAANQCELDGERFNLRLAAIKDSRTLETRIAIDPKIIKAYGMVRTKNEGCLTWKGQTIIADRHHFVDVSFYTPDGEYHEETHKGFQAQVWQHEINHLDGIEEDVRDSFTVFSELPSEPKYGRNDPCPCGSGKKFKKCCIEL